jgi:hypothetical protein
MLEETTRYTVFWELTNSYNTVDDIWIATDLPQGSMFADSLFPEEERERINFYPAENRLVWDVGQLEPGQKAVLAFQLAVNPSTVQDLENPFIGSSEGQGRDLWTEQVISFESSEVYSLSEMLEESPFN